MQTLLDAKLSLQRALHPDTDPGTALSALLQLYRLDLHTQLELILRGHTVSDGLSALGILTLRVANECTKSDPDSFAQLINIQVKLLLQSKDLTLESWRQRS